MSAERRQGTFTGEAFVSDWELVARIAGRFGIQLQFEDEELSAPAATVPSTTPETHKKPAVPYTLEEITSPSQYVSMEHLLEFWRTYRKQDLPSSRRNRGRAFLGWSFLLSFREKWAGDHPAELWRDDARMRELRDAAGLVVCDRAEVGFGPPHRQLSDRHAAREVIQVGGLLNYLRGYDDLPPDRQLSGFDASARAFFHAFAEQVDQQIAAAAGPGAI